ncbi:MAG: SpoIIE family protein phosphatase [Bacteroidales bacterium]|nr:SpoIIE family protein phosphatase [Bacteroidales bacterium]
MIKRITLLLIIVSFNTVFIYSRSDTDSLLERINELRIKSEELGSQGNYKQALQLYKQYAGLKDSVIIALHTDQISNLREKYEKEAIINEMKLQQAETERSVSDRRKHNRTIILWIVAFAVLAILLLLFYRHLRISRKTMSLMQQQNAQFKNQNETIENQSGEIASHLTYASIIQSAILTHYSAFEENFSEYFIFFKPKHIVSGDFYWTTKKDKTIYLAVADCTGHGVQGAFIGFLGMTYLNEIINKMQLQYTDDILSQLSTKIRQSLSENDLTFEAQDGMDIGLCMIDTEKMELQFSGAFNPVYIISRNNLEVLRGDRIPIGYSTKEDVYFSRHHFKLSEGDIIYLLSDGYCDQLGGEGRKKFMAKRFSHLLLDIYQFPLEKQKEWLDKTFYEWMGNNDQVDDVTVIGVKI